MNSAPVEVPTKYGAMQVTFTGNREVEVYRDLKKARVSMPRAMVSTAHDQPLKVNGVEYRVRADLSYGEHFAWQGHDKPSKTVTGWHYVPGEYPSFDRKVTHGSFETWTGDPTDKARATMRDLCQQAVTIAANMNPDTLLEAEAARLDEAAERAENEAQEAAAKAKHLANEAHVMRSQAQDIRYKLSRSEANA